MSDEPGSKGIGAIIVEADRAGVSYGAPERLMGFRGIPSADIYLDDVVVPAENLLIGPGGFRKLFTAFSIERMGNATMSLAIGQAALDRAEYKRRELADARPANINESAKLLTILPNAAELYRRQITLGLDRAHPQIMLKARLAVRELLGQIRLEPGADGSS